MLYLVMDVSGEYANFVMYTAKDILTMLYAAGVC
jgi:hypothetical protein